MSASAAADSTRTVRVLIPPSLGAQQLEQRVAVLRPDARVRLDPRLREDVFYVATGRGAIVALSDRHELEPGTAGLIPPNLSVDIESGPREEVVLVSVSSGPASSAGSTAGQAPLRPVTLHERDQPPEPAGDDREFRLLIDPRHGARHVTQFVGFIDRSRAPLHTHTYEEAIYILEGEGILHVAGDDPFDAPIRPGTSIFLPPGTAHCLENASPGVLKLLGVFSPPGSPGAKRE